MCSSDLWRLFYSLYSQLGEGKVLSPDAAEVIIDESDALKALEFMARLSLDDKVTPVNQDYPGSVALFQGEQAGFLWNGEWEVTTFDAAKMDFGMVPFPNIFGGDQAQADRHSFVIPNGVSPAQKDLALRFISFMLKDSLTWAKGGHIPAYQPVVEGEKYQNLSPQSNYSGIAGDVVIDPIAWFSGSGSQFELEASGAFGAVMNGNLEPEQGLNQFRAALNKLVDTPSPV